MTTNWVCPFASGYAGCEHENATMLMDTRYHVIVDSPDNGVNWRVTIFDTEDPGYEYGEEVDATVTGRDYKTRTWAKDVAAQWLQGQTREDMVVGTLHRGNRHAVCVVD